MLHHAFGPHFFGPGLFPGIPHILLLVFIIVAIGYFLTRKKPPQTEKKNFNHQVESDSALEKKNAELESEIARLKIENELLQKLLAKRQA